MKFRMFWLFLLVAPAFAGPATARETVRVEPARREIVLTGFTRSEASMTLAPEVSGRALAVHYDEGDEIGTPPFLEIDPAFIDFRIEATRQAIRKVEAMAAKNASSVAFYQREFDRYSRLLKADGAAAVQRDQAGETLGQARLDNARLDAEKGELSVMLRELEERKRRHRLSAPRGWIVVARDVEPGEMIQAGVPVGRAADFRTLRVPLSVSGEELAAIRALPEPFDARLEGKPARVRLSRVNPEFDERTRKMAVELSVLEFDGPRRGGLRLAFPLAVETRGIRIPREAVIQRFENPRVVLREGGETVPILVLGESDDHLIADEHPRLQVGTELLIP